MNNAIKALAPISACVSYLLLAGCEAQQTDKSSLLVGSWDCRSTVESPDGGETELASLTLQYLSNHKSNANLVISASEAGLDVEIEMIGSGNWEIDGDYLIEEIEKISVLNLTMLGQTVLMSDLPDEVGQEFENLIEAFQGLSAMSEIRTLTSGRLELYDPTEKVTTKCSAL